MDKSFYFLHYQEYSMTWALVAHVCNPNYLRLGGLRFKGNLGK
jgi:hypothetical protein